MKILEMTLSDFEEIKNILETEFDEFWKPSILESELKSENSKYIVAKSENMILGFAGIIITPDDTEITNIVIKKTERKKGIGSLLLDKLIEMSKEIGTSSISLEVNEINEPAINLYKKAGFEVVRQKKKIL